ncbi:FAD-dependent oxidoreductase [Streptomyces sp. NPDC014870]|uniref:FAD-dependent oxidoreductase n=1 Tax=Streptomyces sp. NPDC014870 TaxID=3364925 RepID=UPI0036F85FBE
MRILVAGGGISGLATAVALGRRGHEVLVLEQRPLFAESGTGISLAPHAFQLLDRLGVGDAVRERSLTIDAFHVRDGSTGELVSSVALPACRRGACPTHATAHRLDVHEPLLEACWELDSVHLRTDSRVVDYTEHAGSVTVGLADGRSLTGDALVLADGSHSLAHHRPEWAAGAPEGHLAVYRTVVPMELVPDRWQDRATTCWVGRQWHISHHPLPDDAYLSVSATRHHHAGGELLGDRVDLEQVLAAFPEIGYAARNLLTTGRHWRAWTAPRRRTPLGWARGRVALVGDSAHPARLLAASGIHDVLEDAVELGASWDAAGGGVVDRLADYAAQREEQVRHGHAEFAAGHGRPPGGADRPHAHPVRPAGTTACAPVTSTSASHC